MQNVWIQSEGLIANALKDILEMEKNVQVTKILVKDVIKLLAVTLSFFEADINECENKDTDCHQYSQCINEIGNYSCQCFDGFAGDGYQCEGKSFYQNQKEWK